MYRGIYIDTSTSGKQIQKDRTAKAVSDLNPAAIPLYKSCMGDVSDNIPSIGLDKSIIKLCKKVTTEQQLMEIHKEIVDNKSSGNYEIVDLIIKDPKVRKKFLTNWNVVFLDFYSVPYELYYPSYNIQETIQRYNLKI